MIEKIAFNRLAVEITRKCQLKCAHCVKGDAQDLDLSGENIDALLSKTSAIDELAFTGGEITLNIPGMVYFLKKLKQYNIPVLNLDITTNGVLLSDEFVNIIKDYYRWISENNSHYSVYVYLSISSDKFHPEECASKAIDYYQKCFADFNKVKISKWYIADVYLKPRGRATPKENNTDYDLAYINKVYKLTWPKYVFRLEYVTKDEKSKCPYRKYEEVKENELRILCQVYLTAKGKIISYDLGEQDYVTEDSEFNIFDCSHDVAIIKPLIDQYNNIKKLPYCVEYRNLYDKVREKAANNFAAYYALLKTIKNEKPKVESSMDANEIAELMLKSANDKRAFDEYSKTLKQIDYKISDEDILQIFDEIKEERIKSLYRKDSDIEPTQTEIKQHLTAIQRNLMKQIELDNQIYREIEPAKSSFLRWFSQL